MTQEEVCVGEIPAQARASIIQPTEKEAPIQLKVRYPLNDEGG